MVKASIIIVFNLEDLFTNVKKAWIVTKTKVVKNNIYYNLSSDHFLTVSLMITAKIYV